MKQSIKTDIVIFGGGVAGLWTCQRLRQAGFNVILFETGFLGGGQTYKAQGIIHGGMKYALDGVVSKESTEMSDIPTYWRNCLSGKGEVDLSQVSILSPHHYLWSPNKFSAKLAGFLAGAALSSQVSSLEKDEYPTVFQNENFKGEVYALDEVVVDVPGVVRELVKANQDVIYQIDYLKQDDLHFAEDGTLQSVTVSHKDKQCQVEASQFVFAAGAGNALIVDALKQKKVEMQKRPLHMVLVKLPYKAPLYAHCMGLGKRPRLTITTHYREDGSTVWYLGGLIAEDGVDRSEVAQMNAARNELNQLFPWLDFSLAELTTFRVDRAEPKQKTGLKPETAYTKKIGNVTIAWPTKLALAPKLAAEICEKLKDTVKHGNVNALGAWPTASLSKPIWETAF